MVQYNQSYPNDCRSTKYNNTVNINVWLKDCEKYFTAANIISDDTKREETLKRLDPTSREIVRELIKNKQLKKYEEIANEIKRLHGTNDEVARNYIRDFSSREQQSTETVLQFYSSRRVSKQGVRIKR
jgi:hypothetical protein